MERSLGYQRRRTHAYAGCDACDRRVSRTARPPRPARSPAEAGLNRHNSRSDNGRTNGHGGERCMRTLSMTVFVWSFAAAMAFSQEPRGQLRVIVRSEGEPVVGASVVA